jgi:hypothetical protein
MFSRNHLVAKTAEEEFAMLAQAESDLDSAEAAPGSA